MSLDEEGALELVEGLKCPKCKNKTVFRIEVQRKQSYSLNTEEYLLLTDDRQRFESWVYCEQCNILIDHQIENLG